MGFQDSAFLLEPDVLSGEHRVAAPPYPSTRLFCRVRQSQVDFRRAIPQLFGDGRFIVEEAGSEGKITSGKLFSAASFRGIAMNLDSSNKHVSTDGQKYHQTWGERPHGSIVHSPGSSRFVYGPSPSPRLAPDRPQPRTACRIHWKGGPKVHIAHISTPLRQLY